MAKRPHAPAALPKPKGNGLLTVAYVHPGEIDGYFHESLIRLYASDAQRPQPRILGGGGHIALMSGPRIAAARNDLVHHFLRMPTQPEWLLMVDSDMVFSPGAVDKLIEAADPVERPLVGGLCFGGGRSGKVFPTLYRLRQPDNQNSTPIEIIEDYPDDSLCRVDATGAAFLLMHRSALEKMGAAFAGEAPWFCEGTVYKGMSFGEDWAFCVRAKSLEIPLYVHSGVKIGHVKPQVIDEGSFRIYQEARDAIGDGGLLQRHAWRLDGVKALEDVPNYVVIPFKGKLEMTQRLVWQLLEQGEVHNIMLVNNGDELTPEQRDFIDCESTKVEIAHMPGANIHVMWNEGIAGALEMSKGEPFNIAFLNNDLEIGPELLSRLSLALRSDDQLMAVSPRYDDRRESGVQYVQGTFGAKGMAGFAFMVKGELFAEKILPCFDEGLNWWYGDDDFTLNVASRSGRVGIVHRASIVHLDGGSQTAGDMSSPEWQAIILRDREYLMKKWGLEVVVKEEPE